MSSAAAFGAALAIVLGIGIPGIPDQWFISANAFIFALFAALMLDGITRWTRVATSGVVLFGIALVFTFNALVSMMQFIASEDTLQGLVFWTMGSPARASWDKLGILFGVFAVLLPLSMMSSWKLTALRLGEDRAVSFGIDVRRLRLTTLLRISILGAGGGLRRADRLYRHGGAAHRTHDLRRRSPFLSAGQRADWRTGAVDGLGGVEKSGARVIIPVGIVTSLVGVPFFLSIILRHRGTYDPAYE